MKGERDKRTNIRNECRNERMGGHGQTGRLEDGKIGGKLATILLEKHLFLTQNKQESAVHANNVRQLRWRDPKMRN